MSKIHGYVFYNKDTNQYLGIDNGYPIRVDNLIYTYIVPLKADLNKIRSWPNEVIGLDGFVLRSLVLEVI